MADQKWEYFIETVGSAFSSPKDEPLEEILNELGQQGWEVFSVVNLEGSPKVRIAAKRPISGSTRRKSQ